MSEFDNKDEKIFYAHLDDLVKLQGKGIVAVSDFLDLSLQSKAEQYLTKLGYRKKVCFFGGYYASERKQIFLLPDYIDEILISLDEKEKEEYLLPIYDEKISCLKIEGSGYKVLTHRDYLGSILALGIKRNAIGDIYCIDDYSAYIFALPSVADLVLSDLLRIGSDKVKIKKIELPIDLQSNQQFKSFSDTISQNRLDAVVASLCNLSRGKAQELVSSGFVMLNFEEILKNDAEVREGNILSIRGYGKFIIRENSAKTSKDRVKLRYDKYV